MKHLDSSQKKLLLPLVGLTVLGLIGGFVRYLHLTKAFDALGLAIRGNLYGPVLTALSVIVLLGLGAAFIAVRFKKTGLCSAAIGTAPKMTLIPATIGTIVAMLAAIKMLADSVDSFSAWGIICGLLFLIAAAVTLPVLRKLSAKPSADSSIGSASLLIVFWASFRLIEIYREVSANPAIGIYLCDVMGMIAMILMFFACSGSLLGKIPAHRLYLMTAACLFFGTVALVGKGLVCVNAVLTPAVLSGADLLDACIYFYGFTCAISIAATFFFPAAKESAPAETEQ